MKMLPAYATLFFLLGSLAALHSIALGIPITLPGKQLQSRLYSDVRSEVCKSSKAGLAPLYARFHQDYSPSQPLPFHRIQFVRPQLGLPLSVPLKPPSAGSSCPAPPDSTQWCLRLASPAHHTEACISAVGGGGETTSTATAKLLGLEEVLTVTTDPPAFVLKEFKDVYTYSLLSLVRKSEGCVDVVHHVILPAEEEAFQPSLVAFPNQTAIVVQSGEKVRLRCAFKTSSKYHHVGWVREADDSQAGDGTSPAPPSLPSAAIPTLIENPACSDDGDESQQAPRSSPPTSCPTDLRFPKDHLVRKAPVRAYVYTLKECLQPHIYRHSDLVVQGGVATSGGRYSCQLYNLYSRRPILSASVDIQVAGSQ